MRGFPVPCLNYFISGTATKDELERNLKVFALSKCFNIKDDSSGQFRGRGSLFLSFAAHWNTGYFSWHLRYIQIRRYFCREACGMLICLAQSDHQIYKIRFWSIHSLNLKQTLALSFRRIYSVWCVLAGSSDVKAESWPVPRVWPILIKCFLITLKHGHKLNLLVISEDHSSYT